MINWQWLLAAFALGGWVAAWYARRIDEVKRDRDHWKHLWRLEQEHVQELLHIEESEESE